MHFFILMALAYAAALEGAQRKASLRGSAESQNRQNTQGEKENLSRLSEGNLELFKATGLLVALPENSAIHADARLEDRLRFVRPWTRELLQDAAGECGGKKPLQVNSATRTEEYQEKLRRSNANAALYSSHVYGSTVDISKIGLPPKQVQCLRKFFLQLEAQGTIEATEEFHQAVFHVMAFRNYPEAKRLRAQVAQKKAEAAKAKALTLKNKTTKKRKPARKRPRAFIFPKFMAESSHYSLRIPRLYAHSYHRLIGRNRHKPRIAAS